MTPWVSRLLYANVGVFLLTSFVPRVESALVLVPALILARPWTLVSYMFLHGGLWHLLFNMLALFFFGPRLEMRLGGRSFLWLYFISGIMGALLSIPFTPYAAIVGASGAVFGVLLGFARFWPREPIYIWALFPIEARWLVIIMTGLALFGGITGSSGGIAHFAHLGGFLGGYGYLKWRERRSPAREFKKKLEPGSPRRDDVRRWEKIEMDDMHPVNRAEVERVLRKMRATGVGSLTADERAFLDRFSSD